MWSSHGLFFRSFAGRQEKSLERFVVSPDGKLISFFGNHGYLILVSAQSKQVCRPAGRKCAGAAMWFDTLPVSRLECSGLPT